MVQSLTAVLLIQRRIVEALQASPALASGNVKANRQVPLGGKDIEGVRVWLLQSEPQGEALLGAPQDWLTTWRIECLARALDADTDPTEAADPLLQAAWSRLSAFQAPGLGVIEVRVATLVKWDAAEADTPVAAPSFFLQVLHRTAPETLQPAA